MVWSESMQRFVTAGALAATAILAPMASADPLAITISEILIDSPNNESDEEYFELKGPANTAIPQSGDYTYYWVELENEIGGTSAKPGKVDRAWKLSGTFNSDGIAFFSPDSTPCDGSEAANYGANMENSGATYMVIAVASGATPPSTSYPASDWDAENSGNGDGTLDFTFASENWTLLDSIGVFCEGADISGGGRLYSPHVSFIAGNAGSTVSYLSGSYVNTDVEHVDNCSGAFDEIEYVGRVQSTGNWFAANLTDTCVSTSCDYPVAPDTENDEHPEAKDINNASPFNACDFDITSRGAVNPASSVNCN